LDTDFDANFSNGTSWTGWIQEGGTTELGIGSPSCAPLGTDQVICLVVRRQQQIVQHHPPVRAPWFIAKSTASAVLLAALGELAPSPLSPSRLSSLALTRASCRQNGWSTAKGCCSEAYRRIVCRQSRIIGDKGNSSGERKLGASAIPGRGLKFLVGRFLNRPVRCSFSLERSL
jgi:hypothetical protein